MNIQNALVSHLVSTTAHKLQADLLELEEVARRVATHVADAVVAVSLPRHQRSVESITFLVGHRGRWSVMRR